MYQTGDERIDTLLSTLEAHWNGNSSFEEAASVTFSFVNTKSDYNATAGIDASVELSNFSAFSAAQEQAARNMLQAWANVADLTFAEVNDTVNVHGNIRFMNTTDVLPAAGRAFFPSVPSNGNKEFFAFSGDVYIEPTGFSALDVSEHGFGNSVLLHEIGHALGLTHPNSDDGELSDSLGFIPDAQNTDRFTVMATSQTDGVRVFENSGVFATGPMLFDILAIQHLYGANTSFRTGNDTYSFNDSSLVYETIWDAGGIDTISVANSNFRSIIDLRAGKFSSIVESPDGSNTAAVNNLAIAFGVTIENATGGKAKDIITGNGARNTLQGLAGNDTLLGNSGNDKLQGGAGNDSLNGGTGVDRLDGGTGADKMNGGDGNDVYVTDSAGDVIQEALDDGTDTVISTASRTMSTNLENATLTGDADASIVGNGGDNEIVGNVGDNLLEGAGGEDVLNGGAGSDSLVGGSGKDFLNGGAGGDDMSGGTGNDTYIFDATNDSATESPGGGSDIVFSSVDLELGDDVEDATLTGTGDTDATGNAGANRIVGNPGDNTLSGGEGSDFLDGRGGDDRLDGGAGGDDMVGGGGDDTFVVDAGGDDVTEAAGGGSDTVESTIGFVLPDEVEDLALKGTGDILGKGNTLDNTITGNGADNSLVGLGGDDVLDGRRGADVLVGGEGNDGMTGGIGADHFSYRTLDQGLAIAGNVVRGGQATDSIADFGDGADDFRFLASAFDPFGDIGAGNLVLGQSFSVITTESYDGTNAGTNLNHDAGEATFVFSTFDSTLYFDLGDADGGTDQDVGYTAIATLVNSATLSAGDIAIVAA